MRMALRGCGFEPACGALDDLAEPATDPPAQNLLTDQQSTICRSVAWPASMAGLPPDAAT
jgi:hypothetical protein